MAIELTEGQNSAMKKLVRFIGSDDPIFRLRGSAGTGKTYLTQMLNQHITNGRMIGCGPTHKSVGVLASRLGDDVDTMTIHRFLGLKPHKRAGEEVLLRKKDYDPSQWHDISLVTLDEASMVKQASNCRILNSSTVSSSNVSLKFIACDGTIVVILMMNSFLSEKAL